MPKRAVQLGRPGVEAAIDVDLLVHAGAVAAVDLGGLVGGDLHAGEDLAGQLAAADGVEGHGGAGGDQRRDQVVHEGRRGGIDDMLGADLGRISACSWLRTMFTSPMPSLMQILSSIWPRLEAAAVCTRAVWPSSRIVSAMPRAVSGLTNQEAPSAGAVPAHPVHRDREERRPRRHVVGEPLPRCAVDIGSHFYCYSFEPADHWTEYFSQHPELRAYFERVMKKYGVEAALPLPHRGHRPPSTRPPDGGRSRS